MAFTSEQEIELWERWSRGEPSRLIARALRTGPAAVRGFLARHGGVRPPERHRSDRHLTALEREEISRGIAVGSSNRAIAAVIGRSASTVSREITRNGGRDRYRATSADEPAWSRARRPKPSRLETNGELLAVVREQLELDWSPQQIARWLRTTRPDDEAMRVSHETIYRSIYVSSRTELGQHSARRLRSGRSVRHARRAKQSHGRGVLRNMTSIRDRPAIVMDRIEVGQANATEYGLVSYVFTEDLARGQRLIDSIDTGMMGLNTGVVSNAAAPFGGVKQSRLGREGGLEGIHEYLETKYVLVLVPI